MEQVGNMKFYTHEEILDDVLGKKGTPRRDKHDEAINALLIGDAIKEARIKQNLTQEELGERIGVKRAQICKLESGKSSITLSTMSRVFQALGFGSASLDLGAGGKVALW